MDRLQFDPEHGFASCKPPIRLSDEEVKALYRPDELECYAPPSISRIAFVLAFVLLGFGWLLIDNADSFLP